VRIGAEVDVADELGGGVDIAAGGDGGGNAAVGADHGLSIGVLRGWVRESDCRSLHFASVEMAGGGAEVLHKR